jgi:hypothetical protein
MVEDQPDSVVEVGLLRELLKREQQANANRPTPPLQGNGGGGTFGGMEARVARLESDVGHIKADVGEIKSAIKDLNTHMSEARITIATLTERMSHLPTKGYIGAWITAGAAAVITGLTLLSRFGWLIPGPPAH